MYRGSTIYSDRDQRISASDGQLRQEDSTTGAYARILADQTRRAVEWAALLRLAENYHPKHTLRKERLICLPSFPAT
ncbi:hypothetical protein Q3C01_33220 [Bradyrhizobium sp. UFLA05-109]